ncbi:hypothetical protein J1614_009647 [Plenodomus biglobosus]|nr:hypothetical protein J1614_009647 [Plenodomus biglobosus]
MSAHVEFGWQIDVAEAVQAVPQLYGSPMSDLESFWLPARLSRRGVSGSGRFEPDHFFVIPLQVATLHYSSARMRVQYSAEDIPGPRLPMATTEPGSSRASFTRLRMLGEWIGSEPARVPARVPFIRGP